MLYLGYCKDVWNIDGLVQERRNSSVTITELDYIHMQGIKT